MDAQQKAELDKALANAAKRRDEWRKKHPIHNEPGKFGDGWNLQIGFRVAEEWIKNNDGATVSFCTNSMMRTGKVYDCEVRDGRAIAKRKCEWWAMSYNTPEECDLDLGEIRPVQWNGMLYVTLGVFNENDVCILRVGKG